MRKVSIFIACFLLPLMLAGTVSAQAWRGVGRLQGIVSDQNGKPIKDAKVALVSLKGDGGPEPVATDAKGRWAAGGLIGGVWNIDISAPGFLTRQLSANVSELAGLSPPMKVSLEPAPPPQPQAAAAEEREAIVVGGVEITPETAQAIEAANAFMKAEKWELAAAEYEKALAVLHDNKSLKFALARAWYGAGQLKKGIAYLQEVYDADTGNVVAASLLADMLLEDGNLEAGQKVLAGIPPGALTDPNTILNIGIRFVNNGRPEDAYRWFDEAVGVAPDFAAAYYYRGIASLQLKKMVEAKADFQKVVALAPDSSEAEESKDLLAMIK
ncbi:MAG TPA: tetratricopeptide repeat protein [Thermoanaerobaculia bacterium]